MTVDEPVLRTGVKPGNRIAALRSSIPEGCSRSGAVVGTLYRMTERPKHTFIIGHTLADADEFRRERHLPQRGTVMVGGTASVPDRLRGFRWMPGDDVFFTERAAEGRYYFTVRDVLIGSCLWVPLVSYSHTVHPVSDRTDSEGIRWVATDYVMHPVGMRDDGTPILLNGRIIRADAGSLDLGIL